VLEEVGGIMSLVGWNDSSLDFYTEIDFKSTPSWIRLLALTPVVEKYAYPVAVRRGFGTIWISRDSGVDIDIFLAQGWLVESGEPDDNDRFLSGSLARLSIDAKPIRKPKVKFTRFGRELAWRKAVHEANGTLNHLVKESSPFNKNEI
jgi:hypothetical protein